MIDSDAGGVFSFGTDPCFKRETSSRNEFRRRVKHSLLLRHISLLLRLIHCCCAAMLDRQLHFLNYDLICIASGVLAYCLLTMSFESNLTCI